MWSILLFCSDSDRCISLTKILSAVDRRVSIHNATSATQAVDVLDASAPTLAVVSDPQSAGRSLKVVSILHQRSPSVPLLVEVPAEHPMFGLQALLAGATDFLKQPVAPWEWQQRARCLLDAQRQKHVINQAVKSKVHRLLNAEEQLQPEDVAAILARANAFHDEATGRHERRTGQIAQLIAEGLGLPNAQCLLIRAAASLHDIGKIGIPDKVLHKSEQYQPEDRDIMSAHPRIGYDILKLSAAPMLRIGAKISLTHHERYDGGGYPEGLAGGAIPLSGRIVAVADAFESLTVRQLYRNSVLSVNETILYLDRLRGQHFDPDCVDALRAKIDAAARIVSNRA